ncbi:DUF6597 domain-containing transcriptional factor [Leptospira sp. WS39.C2]
MEYYTYLPHKDLRSFVKCYWTLKVPKSSTPLKQKIVPDGCIELAFLFGDSIKRYTNYSDFVFQPKAMVIGQITKPFEIEPTGIVDSFAVRFYPYGFSMIHSVPMEQLANTETDISILFGNKVGEKLYLELSNANDTKERIRIIELFLFSQLKNESNQKRVVEKTWETLFKEKGSKSVLSIWNHDPKKIREMERKFLKQVGISPKQLGKMIRLQTAIELMLSGEEKSLTQIAYESDYYDQSHFIKDFQKFTGESPKQFLQNQNFQLSNIFYQKD